MAERRHTAEAVVRALSGTCCRTRARGAEMVRGDFPCFAAGSATNHRREAVQWRVSRGIPGTCCTVQACAGARAGKTRTGAAGANVDMVGELVRSERPLFSPRAAQFSSCFPFPSSHSRLIVIPRATHHLTSPPKVPACVTMAAPARHTTSPSSCVQESMHVCGTRSLMEEGMRHHSERRSPHWCRTECIHGCRRECIGGVVCACAGRVSHSYLFAAGASFGSTE